MMTITQAQVELQKHLAGSPKASHSKTVGRLMRNLAATKLQDAELWETVGLCHDLDDAVTCNDRTRHGILTAQWLENRLPVDALDAIRAHDHRTGYQSSTQLADALKLADALAIADEEAGREAILDIRSINGWKRLTSDLAQSRPYLCPIIQGLARRMKLSNDNLVDLFENVPRP